MAPALTRGLPPAARAGRPGAPLSPNLRARAEAPGPRPRAGCTWAFSTEGHFRAVLMVDEGVHEYCENENFGRLTGMVVASHRPLSKRETEVLTLLSRGCTASEVAGVLRIQGKGGKVRLVPFGDEAAHHVGVYWTRARPVLLATSV